jgi:ATP-dependent DNA helicase DinG
VLETRRRAETLEQCRVRAVELAAKVSFWKPTRKARVEKGDEAVLWVEAYASSLQLHKTPLSIAPIFNGQREGVPRSWIFTSATLAVKNDFKHFPQMGMTDEPAKTWPSPFDYEAQGLLYVPTGLPEPNSMGYTDAVLDLRAAGDRGGRRPHLPFVHDDARREPRPSACAKNSSARPAVSAVRAGRKGRTELLDLPQGRQCVLIGSQSFWEGVDVRGEALSLVIIDKLPFAPPDDPVLAARIEVMEKQGMNGFVHHTAGSHHQPEAGRRPPDPRRRRPRRADVVRSAGDQQAVWQKASGRVCRLQAHARAG